jgi:hypothetical protein
MTKIDPSRNKLKDKIICNHGKLCQNWKIMPKVGKSCTWYGNF